MSKEFMSALESETNKTYTENLATAVKSTDSKLLDFFGVMGASRNRSENELEHLFIRALDEDKLLATKALFYARDIRNGLGERRVFRTLIRYLAMHYPSIIRKNIELIPYFGRWDDLYALVGTYVEGCMWELVNKQFNEDISLLGEQTKQRMIIDVSDTEYGYGISLLAKWLKSANTSSKESRMLGRLTAKKLGLTEKEYRKKLSALRNAINVVESKMSANRWSTIEYSAVPSIAMKNYRNAFYNRDEDRFTEYLERLKKGETKINASTLYPYDIMEGYELNCGNEYMDIDGELDIVLEEQWKSLPNYIDGEHNVLIMADTSGSMWGRPICTSVGLAIYFAERNKGYYKDKFMTFSSEPSLVEIVGESLADKIKSIPAIVDNTDIESAFELVLDTAINNNIKQEEIPKAIVIISDMEFDRIGSDFGMSEEVEWLFYDEMKNRFENAGYTIPNIVFWNVDSRHDVFHAISEYKGVQMASGQSVAVFKQILDNIDKTPYEAMLNVLNRPEYDMITV